jgi:hypothetical protein
LATIFRGAWRYVHTKHREYNWLGQRAEKKMLEGEEKRCLAKRLIK